MVGCVEDLFIHEFQDLTVSVQLKHVLAAYGGDTQ